MATGSITKETDGFGETDPDPLDLVYEKFAQALRNRPKKRRAANTGYIKEIRPHVWLLKVYRGKDSAGKKRYKSETFRGLYDEAARRLTELQLQYGSNSPLKPSQMTLGAVLMVWQVSHKDIWTPATVANHESIVNRLEPLWDLRPDEASPRDFSKFYDQLATEGLRGSTITRLHSVARSALNWARAQDLTRTNPAENVRSLSAARGEIAMPTSEELRAMLAHADATDPHFAGLVRFAAVTGARRSEIAALQWADLEERPDGSYSVLFQRRVSGSDVVRGLKAGRSKRVSVGSDVIEPLKEHSNSATWVFGRAGRHLGVGTITRKYSKLTKALGLDVGTFHGLRHFCGSNLFSVPGMSIIDISAHLGHSRPSTTMDIYAHVIEPDQTGGAEAIARLIA